MRVFVKKLLKNALLSQFVANFIGFIANFNLFVEIMLNEITTLEKNVF